MVKSPKGSREFTIYALQAEEGESKPTSYKEAPPLFLDCLREGGLPIGMQIVRRHHDEWGVLQLGYAFEPATGAWAGVGRALCERAVFWLTA